MSLFVAGAGCGGATRGAPVIGGESHFLHWCSDSCEEDGLECISGLCTQPCVLAEPNACSAFRSATCTSAGIEPGAVAVCDVGCDRDVDCAALGGDYRCSGSVIVGAPCNGMSGCLEIPPAVSLLVAQLQALDALQLTKPPCAAAFASGSGN